MSARDWSKLEEDIAMRMANPGVSPLEEMRKRTGLEFLRDIAAGVLPFPPIGKTLNFFLVEATRDGSCSRVRRRSTFTIRSALCMAAGPVPYWIRACPAPCRRP